MGKQFKPRLGKTSPKLSMIESFLTKATEHWPSALDGTDAVVEISTIRPFRRLAKTITDFPQPVKLNPCTTRWKLSVVEYWESTQEKAL
jgi:hypothetical protein